MLTHVIEVGPVGPVGTGRTGGGTDRYPRDPALKIHR
jgi:hypothetical protein